MAKEKNSQVTEPEVTEPEVTESKEPGFKMYQAVKTPMWHPYQKIRFNLNTPTPAKMDSWLDVQIAAQLIEECQ